jgi:hypothetical protein
MTVFVTTVPVVGYIEAPDGPAAVATLEAWLEGRGFTPKADSPDASAVPTESGAPADEEPRRGWSGAELTAGAGPDDTCGCGEPITMYEGEWLHIYNEDLRGTGDHDPHPY